MHATVAGAPRQVAARRRRRPHGTTRPPRPRPPVADGGAEQPDTGVGVDEHAPVRGAAERGAARRPPAPRHRPARVWKNERAETRSRTPGDDLVDVGLRADAGRRRAAWPPHRPGPARRGPAAHRWRHRSAASTSVAPGKRAPASSSSSSGWATRQALHRHEVVAACGAEAEPAVGRRHPCRSVVRKPKAAGRAPAATHRVGAGRRCAAAPRRRSPPSGRPGRPGRRAASRTRRSPRPRSGHGGGSRASAGRQHLHQLGPGVVALLLDEAGPHALAGQRAARRTRSARPALARWRRRPAATRSASSSSMAIRGDGSGPAATPRAGPTWWPRTVRCRASRIQIAPSVLPADFARLGERGGRARGGRRRPHPVGRDGRPVRPQHHVRPRRDRRRRPSRHACRSRPI